MEKKYVNSVSMFAQRYQHFLLFNIYRKAYH